MIYQLTYELLTPDKDYSPFYQFLEKEMGKEAIHVLRDMWWIDYRGSDSVNVLCDKIREKLGDADTFVLTQLSDVETNGWLNKNSWNWRKDHMSKQ